VRNRSFAILFSGIILSAATLMAFGGAAGARRPFQSQQITTPPAQAPSQQSPQISTPLPQQPPLAIPQAPPHPTLAIVVLDAAHGGTDAGARGTTGINESDIALEFARNVKPALEAQGFRVVETREANEDPSFDERSAIANAQRGAVFITLHVSSTGTPGQVRVYSNESSAEPASVGLGSSAAGSSILQADGSGSLPVATSQAGNPGASSNLGTSSFPARNGMLPWDRAQESYKGASRRFAEIVQLELAGKFAGNSTAPFTAAVRQLRTIAAPAIAVEVSSVSVASRAQLTQMSHDLADAIAHGVVAFKPAYEAGAR
jgi:N-acetylmuramoyl-L-alanine amidase